MIVQFESITKQELIDIVTKIVNEAVEKINIPQVSDNQKQLMNSKELLEYLSCSYQKIYTLMRDKNLPYHRVGRKVYFKKAEIDQYMKSYNKVKTW